MSHTITGIDLGAWSVKFSVLEVGFRRTRLFAEYEERVPPDERPLLERQSEALHHGVAKLPSGTTIYVAVPGEMLSLRVLDLPFADARKIDQVVGYEMEGQMIHELHDVILDHVVLSARGQTTESDQGCRAIVAAARIEDIRTLLTSLRACDADPRALYAAPLLYRPQTPSVAPDDGPTGCRVIVDIGHRRTNMCFVVGDEAVFARTLLHGGEDITNSLVRASHGSWTWEQAEQAKTQIGFVASHRRPAVSSTETRVDPIVRQTLEPWLRELRQTLQGFAAKDGIHIEEILLVGGGARLTGLAGYLADELAVPVGPLVAPPEPRESPDVELPGDDAPPATEADRFVLSSAIANLGARGRKELDLRRGEFQYRASLSIVRQRASHLLMLAAALLVCVGIHATITMRRLSTEQRVLKSQFQTETRQLFGDTHMEPTDVSAALKHSLRDEMAPLPKATAYDLLNEISSHIPPADKVKIDIEDLDIRPKKTTIKGTIDSAAAVDEIVAQLKKIDCFEDISKGPITEVSGGAKEFSLTITSKCP